MSPLAGAVPRPFFRVLTALGLAFASLSAGAQPKAPPPPTNFFTDTAGAVSVEVGAQIEQRLRDFEKTSSNQILVVVADRVPEGYASLEEYTNRTAEAWRVGDKSRDNGAVLFVFVADRKIRIEVGYGLEGALPDALASRIINDEITPRLRQGQYGEGLLAGVDAIMRATKGEYQPISKARPSSNTALIVLFVVFLLFVGVVIPFAREIQAIRGGRTYSGRGSTRGRGGSSWGSGGGFGGWSGGGGSSWGGGGGFSGGGGSFGGGGASGSW
ncbi:MAG: TPM domain-containing protein [Vicinamibacteria bacterium]